MKKIVFCVLLLLLAGCTEKGTTNGIPDPTEAGNGLFETVDRPKIEENGEFVGKQEELVKSESAGWEKYNAVNRMMVSDTEKNQNSLFCIGGETGIIYFVNQKQDYYIYRLKDGQAELAVEIPAKELYFQGDTLYFMVDDYDRYQLKNMEEGDIYSYTPATGEIKLIYPAGSMISEENLGLYAGLKDQLQKMTVDETGIHFIGGLEAIQIKTGDEKGAIAIKQKCYHLAFGEEEPVLVEENSVSAGWRDYNILFTKTNGEYCIALVPKNKEENSENIVIQYASHTAQCCVLDDVLYIADDKEITATNLVTMEKRSYDVTSVITEKINSSLESLLKAEYFFSITQDDFWILIPDYYKIIQINRQTGESRCYELTVKEKMTDLYTDGMFVYVATVSGVKKILTEDIEDQATGLSVKPLIERTEK